VDGIVTVTGKGDAPFPGFAAGRVIGPAEIRLRTGSESGGPGKIEWIPSAVAGDAAAAKQVPFELTGGDWQEMAVKLPADGPLGILRVYLPARKQRVEIDWIELRPAKGQPLRWDFGSGNAQQQRALNRAGRCPRG
jgi:hypothetical protein